MDNKQCLKDIINAQAVSIYGAGMMGRTLYKCITGKPYQKKITSFIVNDAGTNPADIDGIPVIEVSKADPLKKQMMLVALHEKNINGVVDYLEHRGFEKIIPITFDSDIWTRIRKAWMRSNSGMDDVIMLQDVPQKKFSMYVVHSDADRELKEEVIDKDYEIPIQVGAALTDRHVYKIRDDIGDNISEKNKQFCELTAFYWIWKNDTSDIVGISHYRRRFDLNEQEIETLLQEKIDVVVTVPILNFNTVREQYALDHDIRDWDIAVQAIQKLYPDYMKTVDMVQKGVFYYGYNMMIAPKNIFNDYCQWLFDILEYCEKYICEKQDNYQARFAGFLSERLMTIYLLHNKYRIAIADKHFIESK